MVPDGRNIIFGVFWRVNSMKIHAQIIALVILLVIFSGCLSNPRSAGDRTGLNYILIMNIRVDGPQDWAVMKG